MDTFTLIVLIISVLYLRQQILKQHEWNRRKASQDIVNQMMQGTLVNIRNDLENYAKFYDNNHNYSTDFPSDLNKDIQKEFNSSLKIYLNFLEGIALGIKHNIYDDDIVFDYLGSLIPEIYRWSEPYIKEWNKKTQDPTIFIEFTTKADDYRKRNEKLQNKSIQAIKTKGKPQL